MVVGKCGLPEGEILLIDWRGGVLLIDYEEIVESCPLKLEGRIL